MVKSRLGQHFLIDNAIIEKELIYADLSSDDVVLEIGPGKGVLTKKIAQHVRQVIAIELDRSLYQFLKQTLPQNVLLIHGDIMDIDLKDLPLFNKVVANLPFQISSPFTFKLFETQFEKAVLIYQKEFAERMIARPGLKAYSRLTVGLAYKASCRIQETIPASSFSPPPDVLSCLVELIPHERPPFHVIDESFFFELTRLLFSHRRKQINTILKHTFECDSIEEIMFASKRVEELHPKDIALLSNQLYPYKHYLRK
ncbi:MAG: 16S rRNA (adenine(1518)-N(6)/adenine(1519)-N(6))-dimethyltransferase RsmA [Candidatus Thermoplasmatota archaeon]|nr:16S rRNA (adenine(1518)-N(6)/adenine(1519)-N(6))-dimethyltransferase RsmA [Candidatus Thermoplasmatota archaeon]